MSEELEFRHVIAKQQFELGVQGCGWVYKVYAYCGCGVEIIHTVVGGDTDAMTRKALSKRMSDHRKERRDALKEAKAAAEKSTPNVIAQSIHILGSEPDEMASQVLLT